jgi:hypothetical protein
MNFFMKSDDPSPDQLPLKFTDAEVNISDVIADAVLIQVEFLKASVRLHAPPSGMKSSN